MKIASLETDGTFHSGQCYGWISLGNHVGNEVRAYFSFTGYTLSNAASPAEFYTLNGDNTALENVEVIRNLTGSTTTWDIYFIGDWYNLMDAELTFNGVLGIWTVWQAGLDSGDSQPSGTVVTPNVVTKFASGIDLNDKTLNDVGRINITNSATGTVIGDITAQDETWLRINNNTAKSIYTPRMMRIDGGIQTNSTNINTAAFYHYNDSNTGVSFNNADVVGLVAGGTARLTVGATVVTMGVDTEVGNQKISFGALDADKLNLLSNTHGIGVQSNNITYRAPDGHRFRIGGTDFAGGSTKALLTASSLDLEVPLEMSSNKITSLADGTAAADAVNKGQLDPVRTGARTGGEQLTGNKTMATADLGKTFIANISSQITFTFPPGVEAAMGDTITILRWGTGEVVLAKSVSGSLASPGNRLRLASQYSACTVTFFVDTGSNTEYWIVSGDMKV